MENEDLLQQLYKQCINELKKIGIFIKDSNVKIQISKRNNKRYGCCKPEIPDEEYKIIKRKGLKYRIHYENYHKYTIEISPWVMKLNESIIKNTIIHELIHCMPYCTNHGKKFKQYAQIINQKLGYNIARTGNKKEDYIKSNIEYNEQEQYKYKIKCKNCGQIYTRKRLNKNFIKYYRCGTCKGKLEIIEGEIK